MELKKGDWVIRTEGFYSNGDGPTMTKGDIDKVVGSSGRSIIALKYFGPGHSAKNLEKTTIEVGDTVKAESRYNVPDGVVTSISSCGCFLRFNNAVFGNDIEKYTLIKKGDKPMIKIVTRYETSDGQNFSTRQSAETHEATLKPKTVDWSNAYIEESDVYPGHYVVRAGWGSYDRIIRLKPDGTFYRMNSISGDPSDIVKHKITEST